jgi:hypothetical protein
MKKLLYLFVTLVLVCSCDPTKKVANDNTYGVSVENVKSIGIDTFTVVQVDSMVKHDKLPNKSKWPKTYLKDEETKKAYEYTTLYDRTSNIVYTIKYLKDENVYVVKKRKIATSKK